MAFASLFTLLDDIASVLDDVSVMTKIAAKKTAGVIGDDLALNANQVSGKEIKPERELPIVWAVAKGSFINKAILIPLALLLSAYYPVAITPLLMIGGAYLCFEGVEKLLHKFFHHSEDVEPDTLSEPEKIKGAIRTDFILSAEIVIIALGVMQESPLLNQIIALSLIGIGMTIIVYGIVGLIVKLDDFGLWLLNKNNPLAQTVGNIILRIMPWIMKSLSVVGTIAMFLVGGGIFSHYVPQIHHFIANLNLPSLVVPLADLLLGVIIGTIVCIVMLPLMKLLSKKA